MARESGIKVQCICPAFADTEIVRGNNLSPLMRKSANAMGYMTPEFVADATIKLIKSEENGAVMIVLKDTPPFLYPDYSLKMITFGALSAKLYGKVFGTELVTLRHQQALLLSAFISLQLFIITFLMYLM